jgi:alkylhydroperoxidase/carboxymuconolactone decarboxylase family protein YurZ
MPDKLQLFAKKIAANYPQAWKAYLDFTSAVAQAGPLDARTLRLVGLGIAAGRGSEGAVRWHTRRALNEGISADEVRHVALLAAADLGFAEAVALSWIDDLLAGKGTWPSEA